ncbi:MAG: ABC transporter permease subunit [Anaerolineae bacterium]
MTAQTNTLTTRPVSGGLFNPVIFNETLRRGWMTAMWWSIGIASLVWMQIVAVPNADSVRQITTLLQSMPPAMLQMFGLSDMQFMATMNGYVAAQTFAYIPLVIAIYGVVCGLNVISGDEDRGILDMFLSTPVNRVSVIVSKTLVYVIFIIGVVASMFVGLWIGLLMAPEIAAEVDQGAMLVTTLAMIPAVLAAYGFTVMLTGLLRNRGMAITVVSVVLIGSYFLDTLGKSAAEGSILHTIRPLSYNAWYDYQGILQNGIMWGNFAVLLVVAVILILVGMFGFKRRDVGA